MFQYDICEGIYILVKLRSEVAIQTFQAKF